MSAKAHIWWHVAMSQVMAWCQQVTSHHLNQCWSKFMVPYGATRPQWVKWERMSFMLLSAKSPAGVLFTERLTQIRAWIRNYISSSDGSPCDNWVFGIRQWLAQNHLFIPWSVMRSQNCKIARLKSSYCFQIGPRGSAVLLLITCMELNRVISDPAKSPIPPRLNM